MTKMIPLEVAFDLAAGAALVATLDRNVLEYSLVDLCGRPCRSLYFAHVKSILMTTNAAYYKNTTFMHH